MLKMTHSIFGLLFLLSEQSFARSIADICELKKTEASICDHCNQSSSQISKLKKISSSNVGAKLVNYFKSAEVLVDKRSKGESIQPSLEVDVIEKMDGLLESTIVGKKFLNCFRDKSIPVALKPRFTSAKPSTFKITEVSVKFDPSLDKRNAAGKYKSDIPMDRESGFTFSSNIKKQILLNPFELNRPLNLLLVYVHEMQHGCHIHKKEASHALVNEHVNWMSNPCSKSVWTNEPEKTCLEFNKSASKAYQDGIIDEIESFKLMVDLFKELAEASPEICSLPRKKYRNKIVTSNFWQGFNDSSEGVFWSEVEKEFASGQFMIRTSKFYVENFGYSRESLFQSVESLSLNKAFKARLQEMGYKVP